MCIICYKPEGVDMPEEHILENCFLNNDDGAGIMYIKNGKVHYVKGLMKFKEVLKALNDLGLKKKDTVGIHFRIATSGGTNKPATHPFPITTMEKKIKELHGTCNSVLMHNGVLGRGEGDMSDTMLFVRDIVANPLIKNNLHKKDTHKLLSKLSEGSKLLIFRGDGNVTRTGPWQEYEGLFFSNGTYNYRTKYYTNSFGFGRGAWDNYEDEYDWYKRGSNNTSTGSKVQDEDGTIPDCPWCTNDKTVVSPSEDIFVCPICKCIYDETGEIIYCTDWLGEDDDEVIR